MPACALAPAHGVGGPSIRDKRASSWRGKSLPSSQGRFNSDSPLQTTTPATLRRTRWVTHQPRRLHWWRGFRFRRSSAPMTTIRHFPATPVMSDKDVANLINAKHRHCRVGKVKAKSNETGLSPAIGYPRHPFDLLPPYDWTMRPHWAPKPVDPLYPIQWWQNPVVSTC